MARNKSRLHNVWLWRAIIIESAGLLGIMVRLSPNVQVTPEAKPVFILLAVLLMVAFGIVSALVARQSKTRMGRLLIGAHALIIYVLNPWPRVNQLRRIQVRSATPWFLAAACNT